MLKFAELLEQAKRYVKFCTEVYEYQRSHGRYFLHEHPWLATSWHMDEILKIEKMPGTFKVQTHMCQFGMVSRIGGVGSELGPVLKPTGFLTNSACISRELAKQCPRNHQHVNLVGGRASDAAVYPPGLCRAICRGLASQLREDGNGRARSIPMNAERLESCCGRVLSLSMACQQASGGYPPEIVDDKGQFTLSGIQMEVDDNGTATGQFRTQDRPGRTFTPGGEWPKHWKDFTHEFDGHGIDAGPDDDIGEGMLNDELFSLYFQNGVEMACDDVSGATLDPTMVHDARGVEMGFFKNMKVYDKVPRLEQQETKGKVIGTKWIDCNKGDFDNPKIRSRLVGKEFRTGPDDALYASTPPLEALRLLISKAATKMHGEAENEVMVNDVSRAYFYAKCTRCLYVELPAEDPEAHPDFLGRLRLCLYGTRDAALNWQQTLADHLIECGFVRGLAIPRCSTTSKRKCGPLSMGTTTVVLVRAPV